MIIRKKKNSKGYLMQNNQSQREFVGKLTGIAVLIVFLIVAGVSCTKSEEDVDIERDMVIRIRPHQRPLSYNPLTQFKTDTLKLSEVGLAISECVFDGLFNRTLKKSSDDGYCREDGQPCYEYALAKEPITSEDGDISSTTWYIDLKEDKYWHGTKKPVTSRDVIHTYKCIRRGGSESPWRERLMRYMRQDPQCWRGECDNYPFKLEFVFEKGLTEIDVMQLLTFKIIPEEFMAENTKITLNPAYMRKKDNREPVEDDREWEIFNKNPVGTGPYKIKETGPRQIILERDFTNYKDKSLPRYVCFEEVLDDKVTSEMGETVNFMLYTPPQYRAELMEKKNIKAYEYTPYYFYALVFGEKMGASQRNKVCCILNENVKSDILHKIGYPKPNTQYINRGPFPWNWNIFSTRKPFSDYSCETHQISSAKEKIELIYNAQDIRTKDVSVLIAENLKSGFIVKTLPMNETDLMNRIRSRNYQVAIVIWEGFDQDYSISELYTPEPNQKSLNITTLPKSTRDILSDYFSELMRESHERRRYEKAEEIHGTINEAKPYHYLFTLPRTAIYSDTIKHIDEYPIHPETFLPNIRKWRMEKSK
jgi:ABC-type transport system substrate-binding protein